MEKQRIPAYLASSLGQETVVLNDEPTLSKYAASLSGTQVNPLCVVLPGDQGSVIKLIRIASDSDLKIFPFSRGRNLGYGECQGTDNDQVILDLKNLNRIIEVNEALAYATIESGVSQMQLYQYLIKNDIKLQLDVTGAGLDASVTGNMLERGFGHTDYGDRFSRIINLKIATADGKIIRTGFGGTGDADAINVFRYGLGPVLDGLYSQSNFGVVLEMTLELMPKAPKTSMFVFSAKNKSELPNIVKTIRELKLGGVVSSAVHIANKARAIGEGDNPHLGAWNLSGAVSGTSAIVNAKKRAIRRTFRRNVKGYKLWFIEDYKLKLLNWLNQKTGKLHIYHTLKDTFDLQTGVPTDSPLKILLNDNDLTSEDFDPGKLDIGFRWINAVCKADETSVLRLIELTEEWFKSSGYEFRVTLTAVNPRTLIMISNVTYNIDDAEILKAEKFCKDISKALIENGYLPYRAGSGSYDKLPLFDANYLEVLKKIKHSLDPHNIIAPGKYNIN